VRKLEYLLAFGCTIVRPAHTNQLSWTEANVVRQPMAGKDRDDQVTLQVMSNIPVIVLDPATRQRRAVGKGLLDDQHRLGAAFQL
jgi:hypothetical protein